MLSSVLRSVLSPMAILLAALIPAPAFAVCLSAPPDMVAWYPLDEIAGPFANDIVNGVGGLHINGPVPIAGMVAGALSFDGVDDYVEVPDHDLLDFGTGSFSVDFWIYPELGETQGTILRKGVLLDDIFLIGTGFHFYYNAGHILAYLSGTNSGFVTDLSPNLTHHADPGEWTLVGITVDTSANEIRLYIDGALAKITPIPANLGSISNSDPLILGGDDVAPSASRSLAARLDEVELFDRVLSAVENSDIFAAGSSGKCQEVCMLPPFGMTAWYQLDEASGVISADFVNGLDGTQISGPTPQPGRVMGSLGFDGVDDYVTVPDDDLLDFGTSSFSVDFWIFPELGETLGTILRKGVLANDFLLAGTGYHFYYSPPGHILAYLGGTNFGFQADLSPQFTHHAEPGEWTFVAITVDTSANEIKLYIDGALAKTTPLLANLGSLSNSDPLIFGGADVLPSASRCLDGKLDELELFDRILAESEVHSIYQAGSAGKCRVIVDYFPVPALNPIGLLVLLPLLAAAGVLLVGGRWLKWGSLLHYPVRSQNSSALKLLAFSPPRSPVIRRG